MQETAAIPCDIPRDERHVVPEAGARTSGRITELDGLRGMAVILVLLFHYFALNPPPSEKASFLGTSSEMGWCGVDLFFVLSGFLIGGILLDARGSPRYFKTFYLRRLHRIFPLYYLWIGVFFLLVFTPAIPMPAPLTIREKWTIVPVFLFFLQNSVRTWHLGLGTVWLGPLWSLAVEEQFYLLMPWAVRFLSRRWLVLLLVATILIAPLARIVAYHLSPTHSVQYQLTPCRADALAMGALLAVAWRSERWRTRLMRHRKWLYAVLCPLVIGVAHFAIWSPSPFSYGMSLWGFSCIGAFFAGLLLLALLAPQGVWGGFCRWSFLRDIGGVSYCMYLIHAVVGTVFHVILHSSNEKISVFTYFAATCLAAGITWLFAKISWRYLESPLLRRGHAYRY